MSLPDRDSKLARQLVADGALLLDVRTAQEFAEHHLEGSILIPHTELPGRVAEVLEHQGGDKDRAIVVFCRSGGRSGLAKDVLLKSGFSRVTNVGGISDY